MMRSVLSFFALVVMSANCVGNSLKNASGYRVVKTDETTIAQTIYGPVQGYLDGDVFTFKGIPYAQAERFMPPTEPEKHDNVVKCRLYGPKAPQTESLEWQGINQTDYAFGNQFVYEPMDEKGCLVLNVWTKGLGDNKKRPVFVWIHGGGYFAGSGHDLPCYEGWALAEKGDIVTLTLNYRLNVLGYSDLTALGGKFENSVNLGMQDIVMALKWVHDNIAYFGGDPDNVTIGGQSGGGGKVSTLLAMPSAHGKDWTELTATLTAAATASKGELALEFDQPGKVLIDYVSLFTQATFKGRKNGQRADVAQMLVDLHPKFMRWPGGCIVEGATYENRVKWKETLGDPMTRRGEWDLWGYRATWGMGYHEFLQFCEDLGMDGMFVDNAGMSCSVRNGDFVSSDADMDAVIQDFRDAIDYALAEPSKNKWAKMRADAGHPKPFPLKYVEIGNENVGPEYVAHFNYIFKKLKAEYPQIVFINTLAHTDKLLEQIPGEYMVRPHWYRGPDFFFNNNHLFDEAPRSHDIYVGEYACNNGVGAGNLLAALSEAAFIMGMERNSDVVKMTSYAPLFENENRRDWPTNLIHINSSEVFGRASYYVQQMAAENRPTYNVFVSETTKVGEKKTYTAGTIAFGGFGSKFEYNDSVIITPDGKTMEVAADQFKAARGEWSTADNVLSLVTAERGALTMLPSFKNDRYTLKVKVRKPEGRASLSICFGMDEKGHNGYTANIGGWTGDMVTLQPMTNGRPGDFIGKPGNIKMNPAQWYDVELVITPEMTRFFIDGKEMVSGAPPIPTRQFCQAGYDELTGELVIKVVNGTEKSYKRCFDIAGANNVMPTGKVITLCGDAEDENTFEQPTKIAPQTSLYGKFGKQFSYEFAPMSFTIMRIKVAK